MEEKEYTVIGYQYGQFSDRETGKIVNYANLFCTAPQLGEQSENYHFGGLKAFSFRCASPAVLKDIRGGQIVNLYFNAFKRVNFIKPVQPEKA